MNLKIEEILMVVIAFIIGWFVMKTVMGYINNSVVKVVGGKHIRDQGYCSRDAYRCGLDGIDCCRR